MLLALGVPPVRPDRVMLRIAYDTARDPELAKVLDALAGRGYALSLYALPGPDFDAVLLDLFGTVEVDFTTWSHEAAQAAVARIVAGRATPLASGLADYNKFEAAKQLGFELFAGPFYASRHKAAVRNVPVGEMGTLVALAALQGQSATIEDLEQVIDRDVGLSVKLLRYINSAYVGMRGNIASIRQAVMMLGSRGVSRWALLVALTGGPSTPRELSVIGLTRARMCELLGADLGDVAGDQLFTVGLLSVADALLEVPLETIVEELPLADEVSAALLRRDGPAGAILKAVVSYEQGDFDAASLQSHAPGIASSYRDALGWAVETVSTRWLPVGLPDHVPFRSVTRVRIDTLLSDAGNVPVALRGGGLGAGRRRAAAARPPARAEARPAGVRRRRARGRQRPAVRLARRDQASQRARRVRV